ncbi:Crp/Fnr family transcriptional regulator [Oceanihabitans sediminis]|uniref:Crp/Fnr family transcriptional regulator n=1 Tax=Oceanihabitans sediminis TaxID=1812012 RepID=A0A368P5C1_9FLAO|nr:Crp/Fnr family transcriptional regulator [Oceanihabitans sediminis]MDX1279427.1 Crp/Fnr family transcriptional regulator [Oceanihabitans sediminis]RBP29087.1 CRP-like cAMP-binding protein [Oceanihabitans sediminis]RCU56989.1 Crp/Fnr family transcriptional regulator [Oceanihabitans sediminis]
MNKEPFLDYIGNYITLSKEEEALLFSKIIERNYLKDQYIVQQGDVCKSVNFILSGCTKTFYIDAAGQEHIVGFSIADWWTSDLGSFITQSPADFHVQCIESTKILQFRYEELEVLYQEIPKLERLFRKITERAFVASQKRIIRNFSLTAKERYRIFKDTYPKIEQRVPQYMIASYLGITKEFLSKIKRQLSLEK